MAGELETTQIFSDGEQVTSTKLNNIMAGASFTEDAVTGTTLTVTGGKLKVGTITSSEMGSDSVTTPAIASGAITADELATDAVTTTKISANSVTFVKMNTGAIALQTHMLAESASRLVTADVVKYSPVVAKAIGSVSITSSSRTVQSAYNVTSATRVSSTETTINLTNPMAFATYAVVLSVITDGTVTASASVYSRSTGSFSIKHPAEGGTSQHVSFVVYGQN